MKKAEKIVNLVSENKELQKRIKANTYYSNEQFIKDAERYIKAIKEGRMNCIIKSVSSSGMSRVIKFTAIEKGKTQYNYQNFWSLFNSLGFTESRNQNGFTISGCGMDMIFHTNYTIIHRLHRLGFINKKECGHLAQQTPVVL